MTEPPRFQTHTLCTCGYDLYGLAHGGMCPECGIDIENMLQGRETTGRIVNMCHWALGAVFVLGVVGNFASARLVSGKILALFCMLWLLIAAAAVVCAIATSAIGQRFGQGWVGVVFLPYVIPAGLLAVVNLIVHYLASL